jgi:hypothetical protein
MVPCRVDRAEKTCGELKAEGKSRYSILIDDCCKGRVGMQIKSSDSAAMSQY